MSVTTPEERNLRSAEYVLRLLDVDEETAFEDEMIQDAALRTDVAAWVRSFEGLNGEFAEKRPRKAVKSALFDRLFESPAPASVPFWRRVWLWQGISLAAVALAAFLTIQNLGGPPVDGPVSATVYVSEIVAEDESLRLLAVYDPAAESLKITRTAGGPLSGRVLELWAIQGDAAPVSLGVLPDQESATVPLPEAYRTADGLILAISDEPPGGSPTGAPTGAVLAVGQTHEI